MEGLGQDPQGNPFEGLLGSMQNAGGKAVVAASMLGNPFNALLALKDSLPSSQDPATIPAQKISPPQVRPEDPDNPIVDIEGHAGYKAHFWAAENLQKAFRTLKDKGIPYALNSAYRTYQEQADLFAKYGAGRAAAPGHSNHERGWSFDLDLDDHAAKIMEEFGFARPLDHEPWHFTFQPALPEGSSERVWSEDDPRMQRFRKLDKYWASPKQLAQSLAAQAGFNTRDQSILLRLWNQESGFDPKAESGAGALGIGQIMPENLPNLLLKVGATMKDYRTNPAVQIRASMEFLKDQLRAYDGNWAKALAAYNGGPGAVAYAEENGFFPASNDSASWYQQTLPYVAGILGTSPDVAMSWISGRSQGPTAEIPDEPAQQVEAQNTIRAQAKAVLEQFLPGFMTDPQPDEFAQAMLQMTTPTQNPGAPGWVPNGSAPQVSAKGPQFAQTGPVPDVPVGGAAPPPASPDLNFLGIPKGTDLLGGRMPTGEPLSSSGFQVRPGDVLDVGKTFARGIFGGVVGVYHLWKSDPVTAALRQVLGVEEGSASDIAVGVLNPTGAGPAALRSLDARLKKAVEAGSLPEWMGKDLGSTFLKMLEPTEGGYHERTKKTARKIMGISEDSEGLGSMLEWMWSSSDAPFWGSGFLPSPESRTAARASAFALELPYLAGMEIMAQILGPNIGLLRNQAVREGAGETGTALGGLIGRPGGKVEEFTGINKALGLGGAGTHWALSRIPGVRNAVQKLGKPFFEEMSIWGSINATQMMSEVGSRSLMQGKTTSEAAADALLAGVMGYSLGIGAGLGLTPLGFGVAKLGASATDGARNTVANIALKSLDAFDKWEGKAGAARSVLDLVHKLDAVIPGAEGWFTRRILSTAMEGRQSFAKIREDVFRAKTVGFFREHADDLTQQAAIVRDTANRRVQQVETLQQTHKVLGEQIQTIEQSGGNSGLVQMAEELQNAKAARSLWETAQSERMSIAKLEDPAEIAAAQRAWSERHAATLGVKDMAEFDKGLQAARKAYKEEVAGLQKTHNIPLETVENYLARKVELQKLGAQLESLKADPVMAEIPQSMQDAQVMDWLAARVRAHADALESGQLPVTPDPVQTFRVDPNSPLSPREQWRAHSGALRRISRAAEESIGSSEAGIEAGFRDLIRAGLVNDPVKDPLGFHTSRHIRGLLQSESGSPLSRMERTLESLRLEEKQVQDSFAEIRAAYRKKHNYPKRPSSSTAETDPDYTAKLADYEKNKKAWEEQHREALFQLQQRNKAEYSRLKEQGDVLEAALERMRKSETMTDPGAPEARIVAGREQELRAELDAEARQAGFQGGVAEIKSLLSRKTIRGSKVAAGFNSRDKAALPATSLKGLAAARKAKKTRMTNAEWKAAKAERKKLREEITNGGKFVLLPRVPESWLPPTEPVRGGATPRGDANAPIILLGGDDGTLRVADGNLRLSLARESGGDVSAYVPREALEQFIRARAEALPGTVKATADGVPGAVPTLPDRSKLAAHLFPEQMQRDFVLGLGSKDTLPITEVSAYDPLSAAKEWFAKLTNEDRSQMLLSEFNGLTEAFLEAEMPSLKAYRQMMALQGEGIPTETTLSPDVETLVGDLKGVTDDIDVLRHAFETLHNSPAPATVADMITRSFNCMEVWANKVKVSRTLGDTIGLDFRRKLIAALKDNPEISRQLQANMPPTAGQDRSLTQRVKAALTTKSDPYAGVDIPQPLRERIVDALEAMHETTAPMQALLKDFPVLKDVLGGYFRLGVEWEKMKLNSPEMATFFRDSVVFHAYPTMRAMFQVASSSGRINKIPFTRAVSEQLRTIPTLADARKYYNDAFADMVRGPGWSSIPDHPSTAAGREEFFIGADDATRARILGVDVNTDAGRKAVDRVTVGIGLKNPVTDPAMIIRSHIRSVYMADATRHLLRDLAHIPIPGMTIMNDRTGRPYSIVEYFPENKAVNPTTGKEVPSSGGSLGIPVVPSLRSRIELGTPGAAPVKGTPELSRYVSLASDEFGMSPHTKITFGKQQIEAKDLYIHPDVADLLRDRFFADDQFLGEIGGGISELSRAGQLIGMPMVHAANILTDTYTMLCADAIRGALHGRYGAGEAVGRLFKAPFEAVGVGLVGRNMDNNIMLMADAQLHGVNFQVWDNYTRKASDAALELVDSEMVGKAPTATSRLGEWFKRSTTKDETPGDFWNRARDEWKVLRDPNGTNASKASKGLEMMVNAGLNLDYMLNNWMVFTPIKQSLLAGYHYRAAMNWMDMGQKLVKDGHSPEVAMQMCKRAAADYMNTICGTVNAQADPSWFRKSVYFPVGVPGSAFVGATAPGWFRAKINMLLTPLDPVMDALGKSKVGQTIQQAVPGTRGNWGRQAKFNESPAFRNYLREQWGLTLGYGLAGIWAGWQALSFALTNTFTFQHEDPSQRSRIHIGGKSISNPFQGVYRDMFKQLDYVGMQGSVGRAWQAFTTDSVSPFPLKVGIELGANNAAAFRGGGNIPIYNPEASWDPQIKAGQAYDVAKYTLARLMSGPLETIGLEDPAGAAMWVDPEKWILQNAIGSRISDYDYPKKLYGEIENWKAYHREQAIRTILPALKKAVREGDQAEIAKLETLATDTGFPVHGKYRELFEDTDGRYVMDIGAFQDLVASLEDSDDFYTLKAGYPEMDLIEEKTTRQRKLDSKGINALIKNLQRMERMRPRAQPAEVPGGGPPELDLTEEAPK